MPIIITLTEAEQQTLVALTSREQSALDFWTRALHRRDLPILSTNKLPMVIQKGSPGTYQFEWTSRKLGPASIAEGRRLGKMGKY